MMTLDDLLSLPKGTNIAYKRQRWELVSYHECTGLKEPVFLSEKGEYLYDAVYIPHLIIVLKEKL